MHRPHPSRRAIAGLLLAFFAVPADAQQATAVVHGRAIDRNGKPVAGCAVGLFDLGAQFDTTELLAKPLAATDAEGRYQITAQRDHYQIVAVANQGHQVCVQRLQSESSPVRYLPDALLLPGATLRGRVRDADGKPIAGSRVRVEDPLSADGFTMCWFESATRSDAKGIFEVPGVPRTGLRVTVSCPGYPAESRLAAHDSPLDFTLAATGFLRGRVLDGDGKPIGNAHVHTFAAEYHRGAERVVSDADGRFVLTAPRSVRFRVSASEGKTPYRQFSSGLLRGPTDDVVLTMQATAGTRRIVLRCVDAVTKAPIETFRASWQAIDSKTISVLAMRHPEARVAYREDAHIDASPDRSDTSLGTIVVDAPGYGFTIVPVPTDPREPLIAELPAESFLIGRVLDAETGAPAVGAAVHALLAKPGSSTIGSCPDPWLYGAITDADGRYRLGGLAAGSYDVQVYGRGRQASLSKRVTVDAPETTLDLDLPKPRFLTFQFVGDVPADCLGRIQWIGSSSMGIDGRSLLEAPLPPPPLLPLAGPRAHKIGPVTNADFRAQLHLPTRDRLGSGVTIDLGEVDTEDQRIALPDLRQFVHRGRVRLPPDVPTERVALVANRVPVGKRPDPFVSMLEQPFAVCIGSDGGFVIDLPPGRYALQLADLETRIIFHTEADDRDLGPDTATTPIELRPTVRWLELTIAPSEPGGEVAVHTISFDVEGPRNGKLRALLGAHSGSNTRQEGSYYCRAGTTQLRWLIGTGSLKLRAMQNFSALSPTGDGAWNQSVAAAEIDGAEPQPRLTLRMPPPPSDAELGGDSKR